MAPFRQTLIVLVLGCCHVGAGADPSLWVSEPLEVGFSIAASSTGGETVGLTKLALEDSLVSTITGAGIAARRAHIPGDSEVLFLDLIIEESTFYASIEFRRLATYQLPDGARKSEIVPVWEGFSIGAHDNDVAKVREVVERIIGKFVSAYRAANGLEAPGRIASSATE